MIVELIKLAYRLDKKGEYELADDIQEVMADLINRTGINPKDLVALADHFDKLNDTKLADKFDALLSKTKKHQ